jgi:hypothetical protein
MACFGSEYTRPEGDQRRFARARGDLVDLFRAIP